LPVSSAFALDVGDPFSEGADDLSVMGAEADELSGIGVPAPLSD